MTEETAHYKEPNKSGTSVLQRFLNKPPEEREKDIAKSAKRLSEIFPDDPKMQVKFTDLAHEFISAEAAQPGSGEKWLQQKAEAISNSKPSGQRR